MTPPPLPLEIYSRIMGQVTRRKDISAIALCCRAFGDGAQRELFRHPSNLTFGQQAKFFDAVIASPERLGPMVKSYTIRRLANDQSDVEQARKAAAAALPLMCNLRRLTIYTVTCIDMAVVLDCSFQLDMLGFGSGDHNREVDPLLFDFLRKQPSLRHLRIHCRTTDAIQKQLLRDDHTWCPNLLSLGVEEGLMDIFLAKHRPIQHLDWFNSPRGEHSPLQSSHFSSLEYLTCTIQPKSSFPHTVRRMTSLVLLDVFFSYVVDGELLHELYFLENTPQLRYLILAGVLSVFVHKKPGSETAQTAFKLCPTLEHIDISRRLSERRSNLDPNMFDRFHAQDAHGEMATSVVQDRDVYAWKTT